MFILFYCLFWLYFELRLALQCSFKAWTVRLQDFLLLLLLLLLLLWFFFNRAQHRRSTQPLNIQHRIQLEPLYHLLCPLLCIHWSRDISFRRSVISNQWGLFANKDHNNLQMQTPTGSTCKLKNGTSEWIFHMQLSLLLYLIQIYA